MSFQRKVRGMTLAIDVLFRDHGTECFTSVLIVAALTCIPDTLEAALQGVPNDEEV